MVLVAGQDALNASNAALMFPLLLSSAGIAVGLITLWIRCIFYKVKEKEDVERALKGLLLISTSLMTPVVVGVSWLCLPTEFKLDTHPKVYWWECAVSIV